MLIAPPFQNDRVAQFANLHSNHRPILATANSVSREEEFRRWSHLFCFESLSPNNTSSSSFFDDYTTSCSVGFDASSEAEDPDFGCEDCNRVFFGSDDDAGRMDLFENVFELGGAVVTEEPDWVPDAEPEDNHGLEYGFGPGVGLNEGLPEVGMDSEPESDEFITNAGFCNNDDENARFEANSDENNCANEMGEFAWEEMRELDNVEDDDEAEEEVCELEVLLDMNDLVRAFDGEISVETVENEAEHRNLPEGDTVAMEEYSVVIGQLVENVNAAKRGSPAAKSAVENMSSVVLTLEETGENASCPICMNEFVAGEKLNKMPCSHLYHGECILPWLQTMNTCPVCRYELPTDHEPTRNEEARRHGPFAALLNLLLS